MSRRDARETAMKLVFQQMINEVDIEDESTLMLAMFRDGKEIKLSEREKEYIKIVLDGVHEQKFFLDEIIERLSIGWQLKRIPLVDLAILRLAIYEMKFMDDIPVSVVINEYVILSKKYCGEVSSSAINGILGNFARKELSPERLK